MSAYKDQTSTRCLGACIVAAVGLLIASSGASAAGRFGNASGTLVVNAAGAPSTLDPANISELPDCVLLNLYSSLVTFGTKPGPSGSTVTNYAKILPALARSWKVSPDGRTYTFVLRPNLKFANGDPLDAGAVKFSFDRTLKMNISSAFNVYNGDPGNAPVAKVLNPTTVVLRVKHADPGLISAWAFVPVVDPKVVDAHGGVVADKPNVYMATHDAGAGPYMLSSYQPNIRLTMVANPYYYGTPPASKRVIVNFISSESTLLLQAQNSTADITYGLSKQSIQSLRSDKSVTVISAPTPDTEQVILPWKKYPFQNIKVREALAYAVPYHQLLSRVAYGIGRTFYGPIPPAMPYYNAALSKPLQTSLTRAKQLLQGSGVKLPLHIQLTIDAGNTVHQQLATVLQAEWKPLGVDLSVRQLSAAAYTNVLFGNKAQAVLRRDGPLVPDPAYYLGYDLACKLQGTENTGQICIPGVDNLLTKARKANGAARGRLYAEVTRLWRDAYPKIFLYEDDLAIVVSKKVSHFQFDRLESGFRSATTTG